MKETFKKIKVNLVKHPKVHIKIKQKNLYDKNIVKICKEEARLIYGLYGY